MGNLELKNAIEKYGIYFLNKTGNEILELLNSIPYIKDEISAIKEGITTTIGGCTWYIDTDKVVNSNGEDCGTLSDCMTDDYAGRWFYAISSTSTAGEATYPEKYSIDGANGHLSLRDYVIWTGDRLVHIPTFEAKASSAKNSDGKYSPKSGVDGLMSSTDKAYLTDLINRYIAACQSSKLNSGYDCDESGLYGNVTLGRPSAVINQEQPVSNVVSVKDNNTDATSQIMVGETTENNHSLHTDMWFRGDKETTQWMRVLTSDNFVRAVDSSYEGYVNWAVVPGIYRVVKTLNEDTARAFEDEHLLIVLPGAPDPDVREQYFSEAEAEGRVKMRLNAVTQIAVNERTREIKVRYCQIPNLNGSISGKCTEWESFLDEVDRDGIIVVPDRSGESILFSTKTDYEGDVFLETSTREVIIQTNQTVRIYMPKEQYKNWSCIINTLEAEDATVDIYIYDKNADKFVALEQDSPLTSAPKGMYMLWIDYPYALSPAQVNCIKVDDVTKSYVPEGSITGEKLAESTVTEDNIADGAVSEDKLSSEVKEKLEKIDELPNAIVSNALKGQKHSTTVLLNDVSSLEHDITCKVWSKNLLKYPYQETTKTLNGITFTDNGDGSITVNGTATANTSFAFSRTRSSQVLKLPSNTTVTMKAIVAEQCGLSMGLQKVLEPDKTELLIGVTYADKTFTLDDCEDYYSYLYVNSGSTIDNVTVYPQIEIGTASSDWVKHVDPSTLTIAEYGKNLCPQSTFTVSGAVAWKNAPNENVYLAPGTYTASCNFKQTGTKTKSGIRVRKAIYGENGVITGYESITSTATSTETTGSLSLSFEVTEYGEFSIAFYANCTADVLDSDATCEYSNIQIEVGSEATTFEKYVEPKTFVPNENGEVTGIKSIYPCTTLIPDNSNVTVTAEYNRDINKAFAKLEQAIISLGGNV